MQRVSYVLAIILAVLLGVLIATTLFGGSSPAPTPKPTATPIAQVTGSPDASGSAVPSDSPTPLPTEAPTPTPKPTPVPTPVPGATVSIVDLVVDAATDGFGKDRIVTFVARAPGDVTVQLNAGGGNAKMCLTAGGAAVACKTGAATSITFTPTAAKNNMSLTLRGDGASTPKVTVVLTFTAAAPSITIKNARFDGTAAVDTNGIQIVVLPRKAGVVKLTADWGGKPFQYEIDLIEQGGPGLKSLPAQGPATKVTQSLALVPPHGWMLVLQNIEPGFGTVSMTATIAWP